MSIIVTAKELGEAFTRAHWSLWEDQHLSAISVSKQKSLFRKKFNAKLSGGHFDHSTSDEAGDWNTQDAIVEFKSKKDYLLFMLEWS
jgi:hypothetical protein